MKQSKSNPKKSLYVLLTGAMLLLVILVGSLLFLQPDESHGSAAGATTSRSVRDMMMDPSNFSGGMRDDTPAEAGTMREQLEHYIEYAKYPMHSRPLYGGELDLLRPYAPQQLPTPFVNAKCLSYNADCKPDELFVEAACTVIPESVMAIRQTEIQLGAYCLDGAGQRIDLSKFQAEVFLEVEGQPNVRRPPPTVFVDDGTHGDRQAGDRAYRIVVGLGPKDWGWMNLRLVGEYKGQTVKTPEALWFSTPHRVAEFSKPIRETIKDGSLIIQVPVQIYKAGFYEFDANLLQAEDEQEPVGRSYENKELSAGQHVIEFEFFGKVLHDRDINGPYVLKNLRGRRNNASVTPTDIAAAYKAGTVATPRPGLEGQPAFEYMSPGPEYVTKPYFAESFPDEEWTSEEKTERLQDLRKWTAEEESDTE